MVKPGRVILDSNLFVLLVVGLVGRQWISRHKRLQAFDATDFDMLVAFIGQDAAPLVSPNVLTETANLIRQVREPLRSQVMTVLARMIGESEERYVASVLASQQAEFVGLGLTDAVILSMASDETTILTTDLDLYLAARRNRLPSENFNHWKDRRPDYRI